MDDWAVAMLPQPVHAVAMLYLIKECHEEFRVAEEAARVAAPAPPPGSVPFFMTQEIPNACGTVALLHSVAAASTLGGGPVELAPGSWLHDYMARAAGASPDERAALLAADDTIDAEQAVAVEGGQSAVVDNTWQHFVTFVQKGGILWELDGRKGGPINHGPSSAETLLPDAIRAMRTFMARDPEEVRFTMLALCPPADEDQ
jgi:ubiquitin carboxyl-terminal hydrolase L3